jgi:uncharacterized protein (DUF305 family)
LLYAISYDTSDERLGQVRTRMMSTRSPRLGVVVVPLIAAALVLAACGGEDDGSAAGATDREQAFLQAMVPHHESAVKMAEMARDLGEHPRVRQLARAIIRTQRAEIGRMRTIHERLFGGPLKADETAHERLGLSAAAAGMSHEGEDELGTGAAPFDRAFIDAMVPHHQGAIRMADAVLADDPDDEIADLAGSIVAAQSSEIERMNSWRMAWYDAPSPAGGVPAGDAPSGGEMGEGEGHDGH